MKLTATSLGLKLNLALLAFVLVLGCATSAVVIYGFNRTQDDARDTSQEALEEQGKVALQALIGGLSDAGALQFETAARAGQNASRYMQDFRASGAAPSVDTSRFIRNENGVWYDTNPNRISDVVVVNHGELEGEVLDDIIYSAALDSIYPALTEGFPGELSGEAYHPIAITFVSVSGVGRVYPAIGIQDNTPPEIDTSTFEPRFGEGANPTRETLWTTPYEDLQGRGLVMTAQTPVYNGDEFIGIFEVDLSIARLVELVNELTPSVSGFTFYVDTEGEILHTDAYDLLSAEAESNPQLAAILEAMGEATIAQDRPPVEKLTLNGEEYFVAFTPMAMPGGSVGAAAPVDEITEQAALITASIGEEGDRTLAIMIAAMAGLFVAGLAGATVLNQGLLLRPLRRLSEATRSVAEGDLDTRVNLARSDELGTLADSFNTMVDQLRESERNLERQVEERTAELTALIEISRELASAHNLRSLVEKILAQIKTVIDYTGASVVVFRENEIEVIDSLGPGGRESMIAGLRAPINHEARFWKLLLQGQPVNLDDARSDDPLAVQFRELITSFGLPAFSYIRSWLAIPLTLDDQVVGMLTLSRDTPGYFTDRHIEIAQTVARQAAVAAHNAQLLEQTQRSAREQASLVEVSRAIASTLDIGELLGVVLDQLNKLIDYAGAAITLRDGNIFRQAAIRRPRGPAVKLEDLEVRLPYEAFEQAGYPMIDGRLMLIEDVYDDSEGAKLFRDLNGGDLKGTPVEFIRSYVGFPLVFRDTLVGLLTVAHDEPDFFKDHHIALLRPFADQAAIAIDNAQLLQQTQRAARETASLLEVSRAVASTLDLNEVTNTVLKELTGLVGNTGASILTVEGDKLVFRDAMAVAGREDQIGLHIPLIRGGGIWERLTNHERVVIPDINADDPTAEDYRRIIGSLGMLDRPPFNQVRSWMAVPLFVQDRIIGMLSMSRTVPDYFTPDHARLAGIFADIVAVAIENARLFERAQGVAALEERQRLARELHDSVSQALYGIALGARTAKTQLERDPAKAADPVDYILSLAEAGLAEMRSLIFELRPESMEKEGLVAALDKQVAAGRARYGIDIHADICDEPDAPLDIKEAVYRIAQEALHNVVKHARATEVSLSLARDNGRLVLRITDNGAGFDPGKDYAGHLGLKSMRERAALLGGTIEIDSSAGQGTTITAELPAG